MDLTKIKKILVMGDSLSKGISFDEKKKKYYFLENSFVNTLARSIRAKLINAAKFGTTVLHGKSILRDKIQKHRPDVVFLEYGGNDCDFSWDEIAKAPDCSHMPKTPLAEFSQSLDDMVHIVKDANGLPVLMTLPPLNAPGYFKWFTRGDRQKGERILQWLEGEWKIYWWHERYSSAVKGVAENNGVPCIDIRQEFLKQPDFRSFICSDGIHLNQKGHQLVYSAIIGFIKNNAHFLLRI